MLFADCVAVFSVAILAATVRFAWTSGDRAEKQAATLAGGLWLLILILSLVPNKAFIRDQLPGIFVFADFLLAAGLLVIALRDSKIWLGAAMVAQSIALLLQTNFLGGDAVDVRIFKVASNYLSFVVLACIAAGTYVSRRRRQREAARGSEDAGPLLPTVTAR